MTLDPVDYIADSGEDDIRAFIRLLQLRRLPSGPGRMPHQTWSPSWNLAELARRTQWALIPSLGHLRMLTGIMMGFMKPFDKVRHVLGHGLFFVRGALDSRSQGRRSSLTPCWRVSCMWSRGFMLCRPAREGVTSFPSPSGTSKQPSSNDPPLSSWSLLLCRPTVDAEGCSPFCRLRAAVTLPVGFVARSFGLGRSAVPSGSRNGGSWLLERQQPPPMAPG
jgi:hypothetical protein